jgi:rhamnosyltransferase
MKGDCRAFGVMILYHPADSVLNNITHCSRQVDKLYIVANSTEPRLLSKIASLPEAVEILYSGENVGVAKGLNLAASAALNDGACFLLTMDQDSVIQPGHVERMMNSCISAPQIGMLAPYIIHSQNPHWTSRTDLEPIVTAMTSGCLLNLDAYKKTGAFLEKLFIDYVDIEYCLRLQQNGYLVMQLNSVSLMHNLGAVEKRKLFFMPVFPTNHSALRLYYRTRNRCYVHAQFRKEFSKYISKDRIDFMKELMKILLFEQSKIKKLEMICRGYLDFRKNKFGAFV